jgi:tape measure domain-containing protein
LEEGDIRMSSVDDRIVNMKFNNAQFGQGVDKSKRDLTGLEKVITTAGKGKGMTDLGSNVQKVQARFTALQVAGVAALGTIAAKATMAAGRLLKSFTIDPIVAGFKEYQTNLNSIQTIMANTGKDVRTVNKYLDQLNQYADQTVYNFAQMAKNIGTFTAAGVRLDTATQSIKGIANLAALSGSNSQQASTAMYQLSQAIAAGRVGLQDWNSVVNAGMGGKIFQQALARTGEAFGALEKGAVTLNKETGQLLVNGVAFRNTISAAGGQTSWLTGEVLVDTLKQISGGYTDAELKANGFTKAQIRDIQKLARTAFDAATQIKTLPQLLDVIKESMGSTFAQGFRYILGDFEQSKKLWGDVGFFLMGPQGPITKLQNGITNMLDDWSKPGAWGRFKLLEGVKNIFMSVYDVMRMVGGAWSDVFPKASGNTLFRITKAFKQFTENLIPSEKTLKSLRSIFGGVFAVLHIGWSIVTGIAGAFAELFGALFKGSEGARSGILEVVASVAEVIKSFDEWLTSGDRLKNGIKTIGMVVGAVFYPIIWVIGRIIEAIGALASGEGVGAIAEPIDRITDGFLKFVELVLAGLASITAPFEGVSEMFTNLQDRVSGLSGNFAGVLEPLTNLNFSIGGNGAGIFDTIIQGAKDLAQVIKDAFSDIDGTIDKLSQKTAGIGDKFSSSFAEIGDAADVVKGKTAGVYDSIAGAGADAASAGLDKVAAGGEKAGDVFESIGDIFKTIGDAIATAFGFMVEQLSKIPFPDDALEWATLLNALISGALIKRLFFSKGVLGELKTVIRDTGKAITETFGTMQSKLKSDMLKNIGIAIALIVGSLIALSFVPAKKLAQGLGAMTAIFALMALMMKALTTELDAEGLKPKEMLAKFTAMATGVTGLATAMVLMATAIAILTAAVIALSFVPWQKLAVGMTAVIVLMGALVAAMWALSKIKAEKIASVGGAMVLVALAINMLVFAVLALAFVPMKNLAIGMTAVAVGLGLMVGALLVLSKIDSEKIAGVGVAMVLVATAINMLVFAVLALAFVPMENLAIGMTAVAIGMGLMVGALVVLAKFAPGVLAAGAAMALLGTALVGMAFTIAFLGALPMEVLARGLFAMAAGLFILVLAAMGAMPVVPGLLALAVVIKAIGLALLMTGAGFLLFATGLALLVGLGAAAIGVITLAIGAFIALLPNIAIQMAAAFVAFLQAIALAAPKIRKALSTIFQNMIGVIDDNAPLMVDSFVNLVQLCLDALVGMASSFTEAGVAIIMNILNGLQGELPKMVDKATDIAIEFIEALGSNALEFVNAGAEAVLKLIEGLADGVRKYGPEIRSAMGDLADAIGDELRAALTDALGNINPLSFLPDIDVGGLADRIKGGLSGKTRVSGSVDFSADDFFKKKTPDEILAESINATATVVSTAVENAIKLLVGAVTGPLAQLERTAKDFQRAATMQAAKSELYSSTASLAQSNADAQMQKAEGMKGKANIKKGEGKNKKGKAVVAARQAQKLADRQAKLAEREAQRATMAQIAADYKSRNASDAIQYKDDYAGLGAAKASQGADLAQQADDLQAVAKAKQQEIARLMQLAEKDKKNSAKYKAEAAKLRKQAANDTAQAMALATQAIEAQAAAAEAYAQARKAAALDAIAQMAEIRKQQQEEQKRREWQEAYDKADDATRKQMLATRQAENEQKARTAEAILAEMLAIGDALAAKIAAGGTVSEYELLNANNAAAEAAKQAQIAAEARDAAKADADAIKQMNEQTASNNTSTGGAGPITPSRSVLEDAANVVDRYAASVAAAEEAAAASSSTTQFVQNNYSPESLSNSQIYRQTHNLISAAETQLESSKMGGPVTAPPKQVR